MFEGNELLSLIERLRGSFFHRADNYVVNGVGTVGTIAKFVTTTQTLGNSIITESGAALSAAGTFTIVGQSDTNQLIVKGHSTQTAAQIVIQSDVGDEWLSIRGLANGSVIIGQDAAPNLTSADAIAIGFRAMNGVTSSNSIGIGTQALENMSASGHSNIAVGYWAGKSLTDGLYSVLIGEGAGYSITTSINNFMLGTNTGWNLDGSDNIGIGAFAMYYSTTATDSVVIGSGAGFHTDGSGNVVIGSGAGDVAAGGCVFIGYQAGRSESNPNTLHISNTDTATPLIYGDFSTPALTFNGTVTIADGYNLASGTTTGMKLGTSTSQKLGVWNATPIVQPTTGVAAATFTANAGTAVNDASTFDGYTVGQVVKALRNIGLFA